MTEESLCTFFLGSAYIFTRPCCLLWVLALQAIARGVGALSSADVIAALREPSAANEEGFSKSGGGFGGVAAAIEGGREELVGFTEKAIQLFSVNNAHLVITPSVADRKGDFSSSSSSSSGSRSSFQASWPGSSASSSSSSSSSFLSARSDASLPTSSSRWSAATGASSSSDVRGGLEGQAVFKTELKAFLSQVCMSRERKRERSLRFVDFAWRTRE